MEIESEFIHITDDDIAEAITSEVKETALILMKQDLKAYINRMGLESSFKGWISHICPENVIVDRRLERSDGEWQSLWNTEISLYNSLLNVTQLTPRLESKKRRQN
jgi:hypothetical protein